MEDLIKKVQEWFAQFGINIIAALAIIIIGLPVAKFIANIAKKIMRRSRIDELLVAFLGDLVYYVVLAFVIIAALGQVGIQTTSIIAVLGAAGLAVGLALQGTLSNLAAGVLLLIFRPFKIGDYIEGGGAAGTVTGVNLFTTTLITLDNKKVIVPNSKIGGDNIVDYSAESFLLVEHTFNLAYEEDTERVKQILADVMAKDERILNNPAPFISILELGDTGVKYIIKAPVDPSNYWPVFFALNENVKKRLEAEDIARGLPKLITQSLN